MATIPPLSGSEQFNDDKANQPWFVRTAVYDSGSDNLEVTINSGRIVKVAGTKQETTSDTTITFNSPSTSTNYIVFRDVGDDQFSIVEESNYGGGGIILARVTTQSTLSDGEAQTREDLRNMGLHPIRTITEFTSDGSLNVGEVDWVRVWMIGGGAGGGMAGSGADVGAGGGSSGGWLLGHSLDVSSLSSISVNIGSGGSGASTDGSDGSDGQSTSVGPLTVPGGAGGVGSDASGGGDGGRISPGGGRDTNARTSRGWSFGQYGPGSDNSSGNGGAGGASPLGDGGLGGADSSGNGGNGGTAAGGGGSAQNASGPAGDGGDGYALIEVVGP